MAAIAILSTYWVLAIGAVMTVILDIPLPVQFKQVRVWRAAGARRTIVARKFARYDTIGLRNESVLYASLIPKRGRSRSHMSAATRLRPCLLGKWDFIPTTSPMQCVALYGLREGTGICNTKRVYTSTIARCGIHYEPFD